MQARRPPSAPDGDLNRPRSLRHCAGAAPLRPSPGGAAHRRPALTSVLQTAADGLAALGAPDERVAAALAALRAWLEDDDKAAARPQLESLVRRGCFEELIDAFGRSLPFGTSGRRGPVGFGPNRFSPWTLARTVQGHAELLKADLADAGAGEGGGDGDGDLHVVIGFDVRVFRDRRRVFDPDLPNPLLGLTSAALAAQAAGIYVANGVRVSMPPPQPERALSTPELSLAVRRLGAQGGLAITASHNPPDDNGGKVYNAFGAQDTPPRDEILARRVEGVGTIRRVPFDEACAAGRVTLLDAKVHERYRAVVRRLAGDPEHRDAIIVFTPLHGTGGATVGKLLEEEGFALHGVPEQWQPDGDFPTLGDLSPNPELPACFAAAEALGAQCHADLLLATDADADRLGLEVPETRPRAGAGAGAGASAGATGAGPDARPWRFVTGNEQIFLVLRALLERRMATGRLDEGAFVLTTRVTSSLVGTIARSYGCRVIDHLPTGCRSMAEVLASLEAQGRWRELVASPADFVLGAEESHGVMVTSALREKDAGGAALILAELAARSKAEGRNLGDVLDSIYARFGYVAHHTVGLTMAGEAGRRRVAEVMASLRAEPPAALAGSDLRRMEDLADPDGPLGPIRSASDARARDVLTLRLQDGARLSLRPSGTEPKIKLYVEMPGATPRADLTPDALARTREECDARASVLASSLRALLAERGGPA